MLPTLVFLGFPCDSGGKESAHNSGELGSIPGLGRSPGEGRSYILQYPCWENLKDSGAWLAIGYGVTKSQTKLSNHAQSLITIDAILLHKILASQI